MSKLARALVLASISAAGCGHVAPDAAPPPSHGGAVAAIPSDDRVVHVETTWRQDAKVEVTSDDPALGPKDARVTVVEFADFQCPFCQRAEPTLKELRARYGDDVRVVWKDLPLDFHKNARPAAIAARVAFMAKGNAAFWALHDRIFEHAGDLGDRNLGLWLEELGVTRADYDALARVADARVKANMEQAKQLGIQGTPNFFIDGEQLAGAQPIDAFVAMVDAHRKKAAELEAQGVSRDRLYVEMTAAYYRPPTTEPDAGEEPDDLTVYDVEVGNAPVLGKADALVTIVTFADFQCPFCKRLEPTLGRLKKDYGDRVRLVFKMNPLPFHARAMAAAELALEARAEKGNDGFWRAHDALFDLQPKLEDADLEGAARALGLDWAKVSGAIQHDKWKAQIEADLDQGEALSVRGTPHSFVNGRALVGSLPYETFKHVVDQELAKAEAKVKAGTPADRVYAETIKGGKIIPNTPLALPAWSPWRGAKDAKVVIHVFSDFQCPYCKRAEFDVPGADGAIDATAAGLKAAIAKYGDKLKIVWRNYPLGFHVRAEPVAQFAMCAMKTRGNATFWKVHDELFLSQPKLEDADLEAIAKKTGVDWKTCKKAMDDHAYKAEIDEDVAAGNAAGVTGTPAFIVNGKAIVGAQPLDAFVRVIDKALAKPK